MKSRAEIKQKVKQATYRHVKRVLRSRFAAGEDWPRDEVDQVKAEYKRFFETATIPEIAREFPDVAALLWVLDERSEQDLVVNGTLVGSMGGVMLWADTHDEAEEARVMIDRIVEAALHPKEEVHSTVVDPDPVSRSWWQRLFG